MKKHNPKIINDLLQKSDIIIAILLTQSGLEKKDVAKVFGFTRRNIQSMIPFKQIKQSARAGMRDICYKKVGKDKEGR